MFLHYVFLLASNEFASHAHGYNVRHHFDVGLFGNFQGAGVHRGHAVNGVADFIGGVGLERLESLNAVNEGIVGSVESGIEDIPGVLTKKSLLLLLMEFLHPLHIKLQIKRTVLMANREGEIVVIHDGRDSETRETGTRMEGLYKLLFIQFFNGFAL